MPRDPSDHGVRQDAGDAVALARSEVEDDPVAALGLLHASRVPRPPVRDAAWMDAVAVRAMQYTGRMREAETAALTLPARFRAARDPAGAAYALTDLSTLLMTRGDVRGARSAIAEGLVAARAAGDPALRAQLLLNLAFASVRGGDLDRGEREATAGLRAAMDCEPSPGLGTARETGHFQLVQIHLLRLSDRPWRPDRARLIDGALAHAARAMRTAGPRSLVETLRWRVEALLWAGERDDAAALGLQAPFLAPSGNGEIQALARVARALGYAALDDRERAIAEIHEAVAVAPAGGWACIDAGRARRDIVMGVHGSD